MERAAIVERVCDIVARETYQPEGSVTEATVFADLTDSLGLVELVLKFEDEFRIIIPNRDLRREFKTVADAVSYIESHHA